MNVDLPWLPIELAPTDGSWVLAVARGCEDEPVIAGYYGGQWHASTEYVDGYQYEAAVSKLDRHTLTHFCYLNPPKD